MAVRGIGRGLGFGRGIAVTVGFEIVWELGLGITLPFVVVRLPLGTSSPDGITFNGESNQSHLGPALKTRLGGGVKGMLLRIPKSFPKSAHTYF